MQDTAQNESVVVEGVIESKETKLTRGKEDESGAIIAGSRKEFISVEIQEAMKQYPTKVNCWDEGVKKQVANYSLGDYVTMYITEEKKMSNYSGQVVTYRNGVHISANSEVTRGDSSDATSPLSKPKWKPNSKASPMQGFSTDKDSKDMLILDQVIFKCSVKLMATSLSTKTPLSPIEASQLARDTWLAVRGHHDSKPEATQEPEKPVKAEEELFSEDEAPIAQIKGDTDENISGDSIAKAENSSSH